MQATSRECRSFGDASTVLDDELEEVTEAFSVAIPGGRKVAAATDGMLEAWLILAGNLLAPWPLREPLAAWVKAGRSF